MDRIVGRCSICGGRVTMPNVWLGAIPPVPTCENCGATKKENLPVIEMESLPKKNSLRRRKYDYLFPDGYLESYYE